MCVLRHWFIELPGLAQSGNRAAIAVQMILIPGPPAAIFEGTQDIKTADVHVVGFTHFTKTICASTQGDGVVWMPMPHMGLINIFLFFFV
jgi:hypothetical protein